MLQPVVAAATGQATGVLEVYLPYEQIAKTVEADTRRTIWRVGAGLIVLYAVLALISWWTTRALRRNAAAHEHQALHDTLTGLPNREYFRRSAEAALSRGRRGEGGAVVLMDLDHFKEVNDTLGHHAGDELLRVVAERLRDQLRTDDTVARLGGDEFGLVLPGNVDRAQTVALLSRIREELGQEIVLGSVSLHVVASFGVCFYPDDAGDLEALLQHADSAMYQGKHGPTGVVVYEPDSAGHPTHSLVVQAELRQALERDELVLYYQPKYELGSGEVHGVEALVRWQHPERGLLPPSEFLPVAERSDLIEPLTTWVLRRALTDLRDWTARGLRLDRRGQRLGPQPELARLRPHRRRQLVAEAGAPTETAAPGGHRDRAGLRRRCRRRGRRSPGRAGSVDLGRRLRDRLHQPVPAAQPGRVRGQDRPHVRGRPVRQRAGPRDRRLGDRARAQPRLQGHRRGRGDPGRRRLAARRRLRPRTGLPVDAARAVDGRGRGTRPARRNKTLPPASTGGTDERTGR